MTMRIEPYVSRPVEIEAVQLPRMVGGPYFSFTDYVETCTSIAEWCGGTSYMMVNEGEKAFSDAPVTGPYMLIPTLEGDMHARPDDWIIKGTEGEFYPCKDTVFRRKYTDKEQLPKDPTELRYYGSDMTIHDGGQVDVEMDPLLGKVVAVWFRCQPLQFKESRATIARSNEMQRMYKNGNVPGLDAVVVREG